MSALKSQSPSDHHWTDEITEAKDFDVTYKDVRLRSSAMLAVTFLTLASFVGLSHYDAPLYAYLVASGTGLLFGLLVKRQRWRKRKEYG